MKEIFQKLKLPVIGLVVLLVGFVMYREFASEPESNAIITSTNEEAGPERDFLPILLQIQSVNFDERLFTDAVFRALVDFSQPIVPEPVGKPNPFGGAITGSVNSSVESLGFVEETGTPAGTGSIIKRQ